MVTEEAQIVSVALNAKDIPGIAYGSHIASTSLDFQLVRAATDPLDNVVALVDFLQQKGRERDYVALLFNPLDDVNKEDFQQEFQDASSQTGLQVQTVSILNGNNQQQGIGYAMDEIYQSGFRTIIVALYDDGSLPVIASEADKRGMLSDEFWWIFLDTTVSPEYIYKYSIEAGTALDRLFRGSAIFKLLDGFDWNPNDRFLPAWRSLNATFVEQLNALYPNTTTYQFRGNQDFFRTEPPPTSSSFVYDAVIIAGLAKCKSDADLLAQGSGGPLPFNGPPGSGSFTPPNSSGFPPPGGLGFPPPPGGGIGLPPPFLFPGGNATGLGQQPDFSRPPLNGTGPPLQGGPMPIPGETTLSITTRWLQNILNISFQGASGQISFIERLNVRNSNSVAFGIFNIQTDRVNVSAPGLQYKAVLTNVQLNGTWQSTNQPYIFRDGTSNMPKPTRSISDNNFIPRSVRVTGIFFMAIAQALCLVCGIFVWVYRSDRIMTASQPVYLYCLCLGSFLFSSSILMRSFDESVGLSARQLDGLCMASPWLVSLGDSVIYLSLFSKLWRVHRVFQFRRGLQVSVRHVIGPFLCFVAAILVTMTVWQIVSPWRWVRVVIDGSPPKTTASCKSEHGTAFVAILAAVVFLVTLLTLWMSWKTRDTPADVSDSARVRFTILTHLQSLVVGVPIIIILNGKSQNALFLGFSLLVSTISITSVSFLIVPKMFYIWFEKKNQSGTSSRRNVFISGFVTQGESSSFRLDGSTVNFEARRAATTLNQSTAFSLNQNSALTSNQSSALASNQPSALTSNQSSVSASNQSSAPASNQPNVLAPNVPCSP